MNSPLPFLSAPTRVHTIKTRNILALASMVIVSGAYAQSYPSKPVRFIVPFAAGGGADFVARVVAQKFTMAFGQQLVIDNRGGAGGRTRAVSRVPACGM